ncbi:unnamed protein product [Arabidopsis halleri]
MFRREVADGHDGWMEEGILDLTGWRTVSSQGGLLNKNGD